MSSRHKDLADPPCEVNWSNRKCLSESVKLDKDDKRGDDLCLVGKCALQAWVLVSDILRV